MITSGIIIGMSLLIANLIVSILVLNRLK